MTMTNEWTPITIQTGYDLVEFRTTMTKFPIYTTFNTRHDFIMYVHENLIKDEMDIILW